MQNKEEQMGFFFQGAELALVVVGRCWSTLPCNYHHSHLHLPHRFIEHLLVPGNTLGAHRYLFSCSLHLFVSMDECVCVYV